MADSNGNKITRTLQMYAKLEDSYVINKREEVRTYNVDERSIARDIDDIRSTAVLSPKRKCCQ